MAMMKIVDMAIIRAVARCPWPESSAGIKERRINGFEGPSSKPPGDPITGMLGPWIILPRTWPSNQVLAARSELLISFPHTANWVYVHYTWRIRMQNKKSLLGCSLLVSLP